MTKKTRDVITELRKRERDPYIARSMRDTAKIAADHMEYLSDELTEVYHPEFGSHHRLLAALHSIRSLILRTNDPSPHKYTIRIGPQLDETIDIGVDPVLAAFPLSKPKEEEKREMKVKIFDQSKPKEKELYLMLEERSGGRVTLSACDENGHEHLAGKILSVLPDGRVALHRAIDPSIGLDLDPNGKVKTAPDD